MEKGSTIQQYLATFACNFAAACTGCELTWTSFALAQIDPKNESIYNSWIASLLPVGACIAPFIAGIASNKIGRRMTLLLSGIPVIVGWILMMTYTTVAQILVARFLWGISVGCSFTVIPIYVGEIAEDSIRGGLGSFLQVFLGVGMLYSYCVGPYTSFKMFCYISIAWPIAFIVLFFFCPESPYYYLSKKNTPDATKSLMILRGKREAGVQAELAKIKTNIESVTNESGSFRGLVETSGRRKALLISLCLIGFQQMSGINAVLFYAQSIFEEAGGSLSPAVSGIFVGLTLLLSSCITPFIVDRLGRKILLLISGSGMAIGDLALGVYFYLKVHKYNIDSIPWLPISSLVLYMTSFCVGFGPLAWAIMGEIFAPNVRGLGSLLTASFAWLISFFLTYFFKPVSDKLGSEYVFWFFTVVCILGTAFVALVVPETKGKSLQEIQDILEGK